MCALILDFIIEYIESERYYWYSIKVRSFFYALLKKTVNLNIFLFLPNYFEHKL